MQKIIHGQLGFTPRQEDWFNIRKVNIIQHCNNKKNQMIISIDTEKAFDKIKHLFMRKTHN